MDRRPESRRPSVVFLNRFYWPDTVATAQMLTDLAEELSQRGWRVIVIASRRHHSGASDQLPARELRRGVEIIRVPSPKLGRGLLARVVQFAAYLVGASFALARLSDFDIAVALTDPPLLVVPTVVITRLRGKSAVLWSQDVYPEIAARLGVLSPTGLPFRMARRAAHWAYRGCGAIVALGPQMKRLLIDNGADPERVAVIHNWADADAIQPLPREGSSFRAAHGLGDQLVLMYSGNMGRAHEFETLMGAMRALAHRPDIVFVFVGDGARRQELAIAVGQSGLSNVKFINFVPRESLGESLGAADISLVTEDPCVVGTLLPSKTYGILASGRPLLFIGAEESDVAHVVRTGNCGWVIAPGDVGGLVGVIESTATNRAEAERLGRNGRALAEGKFNRGMAANRWDGVLRRQLAGGRVDESDLRNERAPGLY